MPPPPFHLGELLADASAGAQPVREFVAYQWSRLGRFDDPRLFWALSGLLVAAMIVYIVWLYRRDGMSLPPLFRWSLPGLRLLALAGLVLYFLGLEKRTDRQTMTDSQVLLLVDTSQSMSVEDEATADSEKATRSAAIAAALEDSPLIDQLRDQHDVTLAAFDEKLRNLVRLARRRSVDASSEPADDDRAEPAWLEQLQPRGGETRLGGALKDSLDEHRDGPLAAVIVLSDGGQNIGVEPLAIAEMARLQQIPFYTVGVGSTQPRRNLRIQELSAPSRVYPEDDATIRALVQGEGFAGRTVEVQLFAREGGAGAAVADLVAREEVHFHQDRQLVPLQFEIEPAEIGQLLVELRIVAPADDQYSGDDRREVEIEVVEARTRVMLIASGATRDYRFLRNQLRRDRHATVDVWLQSAPPGISQDADLILSGFPRTKEELYHYDCIVAFDPDWMLLDAQQVELLESWVAEEAGGLIVVAGPVHTAAWVQSPEHGKIRALYPVEFQRRWTLLDDGLYGSKIPWPIDFSRAGEESDYLWLADTAAESRSLWTQFAGVFGCYAVKGPKPGARVLGRYSDPDAGISADRPVYLAEHFYGGGRVFYMGSGELWRLRTMDPRYFEIMYTRLIRHVSEGRLLRGSTQGRLLVERDRYTIGDDVIVRAQLSSESREPLIVPHVTARVEDPQGEGVNLRMIADEDRPGNFVGQFNVRREGAYRIELPVPDSLEDPIVRRLQVVAPNLEFDKTRRNEQLLAGLATRSGGKYYSSLAAALGGRGSLPPLGQAIDSRAELKTLQGTPDEAFAEWLNRILLAVICGALCLEWLLRRLLRLA